VPDASRPRGWHPQQAFDVKLDSAYSILANHAGKSADMRAIVSLALMKKELRDEETPGSWSFPLSNGASRS
jgi:hypothetical protein